MSGADHQLFVEYIAPPVRLFADFGFNDLYRQLLKISRMATPPYCSAKSDNESMN